MARHCRRLAFVLLVAILNLGSYCIGADADAPPARAAVVVVLDEAHYVVRTVSLPDGTITGQDALARSGLAVSVDQGFVCSIAGVGCAYPAQLCMCSLPLYWAYSHWQNGAWAYSGVGAGSYPVSAGAIEGWAWGGRTPLPQVSAQALFDDTRLAPAPPLFAAQDDHVIVQVDVQGDSDGDGQAAAHWQRPDGSHASESVILARDGTSFIGLLLTPTAPGAWALIVTCADADGLNGTAVWRYDLSVEGVCSVNVPVIINQATVAP